MSGLEDDVQALYETTQELCSRLDVDVVLGAIVARAHQMLGTDVAYLAINDDRHKVLRMRAHEGIRTEAMRSLVLPHGLGVGGRVAAAMAPASTADYLHDLDVEHRPEVDEIVIAEGLVAAVGAPVVFDGRLLAVLLVANRRPTDFTKRQRTLLSSFANSAAIALNNAQIHGRLVRATTIHRELMSLALTGTGTQAIAERLAGLVSGSVQVVDTVGQTLADAHVVATSEDEGQATRSQTPIRLGKDLEGYLNVNAYDDELSAIAIEQAATVFALELAKLRSVEETEMRLIGELLDQLLAEPPGDEAMLLRRAFRIGCDLRQPHAIAIIRPTHDQTEANDTPWRQLRRRAEAALPQRPTSRLIAVHDGCLTMVVAAAAPPGLPAVCAQLVAAEPTLVAGIGRVASGLADLADSHQDARHAADVAVREQPQTGVLSFADLGLHRMLIGSTPTDAVLHAAKGALAPLRPGTTRGANLVATLRQFLDHLGNVEATGRAMQLHPNTVRHRLGRIEGLLGRSLEDARTRLDIQLALEAVGNEHPRQSTAP